MNTEIHCNCPFEGGQRRWLSLPFLIMIIGNDDENGTLGNKSSGRKGYGHSRGKLRTERQQGNIRDSQR